MPLIKYHLFQERDEEFASEPFFEVDIPTKIFLQICQTQLSGNEEPPLKHIKTSSVTVNPVKNPSRY
jgi:hypothetical protein